MEEQGEGEREVLRRGRRRYFASPATSKVSPVMSEPFVGAVRAGGTASYPFPFSGALISSYFSHAALGSSPRTARSDPLMCGGCFFIALQTNLMRNHNNVRVISSADIFVELDFADTKIWRGFALTMFPLCPSDHGRFSDNN